MNVLFRLREAVAALTNGIFKEQSFFIYPEISCCSDDSGENYGFRCNLSDGIYEYAKARGRAEGEISMLIRLLEKGRITVEEAAAEANMSVEKFKETYLTPAMT